MRPQRTVLMQLAPVHETVICGRTCPVSNSPSPPNSCFHTIYPCCRTSRFVPGALLSPGVITTSTDVLHSNLRLVQTSHPLPWEPTTLHPLYPFGTKTQLPPQPKTSAVLAKKTHTSLAATPSAFTSYPAGLSTPSLLFAFASFSKSLVPGVGG